MLQTLESGSSLSLSASRDLLHAAWASTTGRLFRRNSTSTTPTKDECQTSHTRHKNTPAPFDDEGERQQHTPQRNASEPSGSTLKPCATAGRSPPTPIAYTPPEQTQQHPPTTPAAAQTEKSRITWDNEEVVTLRAAPGPSPSSSPTAGGLWVQPPPSPAARATRLNHHVASTHNSRLSTPARRSLQSPRGGNGENNNHRGDATDDSSAEFTSATSSGTLTARF